jgi:hypothetical protein
MRRLEWTVIRRLDGQLQGDYRTLFRGAGLMLADLREYQAHDDVRHIDWNVTARMQTPYVREHQEDREMAAWFLIDLSRSVAFGSGQTSKRMLAAEVVGVLARMLLLQALTAGLLGFGLGVGMAQLIGRGMIERGMPPFVMYPQILWATFILVLGISFTSALIGMIKVARVDPASVFRG